MIILADENIPSVQEAFSELGDLGTMPGRSISARSVRDAGVLLVRSVTKVNRALLEGSRVRFVGSATAGTDHVDAEWLRGRGIELVAAPGSNAESVAEYVAAVLFHFRSVSGWDLSPHPPAGLGRQARRRDHDDLGVP